MARRPNRSTSRRAILPAMKVTEPNPILPREQIIGMSLRGCLHDLLDGNQRIEQVRYIISPTICETRDRFLKEAVGRERNFPIQIRAIAERLWDQNKIRQPLLEGGPPIPTNSLALWA